MDTLVALNNIVLYLGYDATPLDRFLYVALSNLQSQIYHLYRTLDDYGLSTIISREARDFLSQFSYVAATEFRSEEKRLIKEIYDKTRGRNKTIKDLQIPEEAWNRFWLTVDRNKGTIVTKMQVASHDRFLYFVLYKEYVENAFRDPLGNFTLGEFMPMSPFNWSKALCSGIGATLLAVNALASIPSAGITAASFIGGLIASSIAGGI